MNNYFLTKSTCRVQLQTDFPFGIGSTRNVVIAIVLNVYTRNGLKPG